MTSVIKRASSLPLPPTWQSGSNRPQRRKAWLWVTVGLRWTRSLPPLTLTLTFLSRQQMRSIFFKRSRCRGGKDSNREREGAGTGCAPPHSHAPHSLHVATGGRQSRLCGVFGGAAGKQPRGPHSDRHHGGIFTRVSTATAQSPATAAPPGGTRALSPRQVFAGGGDRQEEGARPPPPTHTPVFPSSRRPPPATYGKTDGRTHLGTAHVSLTARAGMPWSLGFLKSVRSSSKAMIWGRGVCPSGLGQQLMALPPIRLWCEIHTWGSTQMKLAAKVEKLRPREGAWPKATQQFGMEF